MRYAELFAGAGGLSLGLERAGFSCAWHAEISEFPRRVLSHHWPDTPLYGDVAKLDGRELVERHGPIDLLSGGSPCQDLSVAGKRKGMTEGSGTRSSLFYEQLRLWNETEAEFLLWENVDGARSSNNGKDFGAVLSAIVGAAVFVPSDGWRSGGVAVGPEAVAAWRILDAQFFGVPQRRRRVFVLGSRTCRADPAEILSLAEGLRGDTAPSGEAWEGFADSARGCVEAESDIAGTLQASGAGMSRPAGMASEPDFVVVQQEAATFDPVNITSKANRSRVEFGTPSNTLHSQGMHVLAFGWQNSESQGDSVSEEVTPSLDKSKVPAVFGIQRSDSYAEAIVDATIASRDYKSATDLVLSWDDECNPGADIIGTLPARAGKAGQTRAGVLTGIPRRLMPIECERLMGWPDNWTNIPDTKGKLASDSNRYKACGNGVVSHCVQWIGERLICVGGNHNP